MERNETSREKMWGFEPEP